MTIIHAVDRLIHQVQAYLPPSEVELVRRAYDFAAEAHGDQLRQSGEPYVNHPLAAADTLVELRLDASSIAAALLHDVPEDVGIPIAEIESRFGSEVAKLVDGVTKLSKVSWWHIERNDDRTGRHPPRVGPEPAKDQTIWAENMRKMFLAMADDIRVVLIKLADRLHNMRTLDALPEAKRHRIAQETMEIYAPLANRLGIWQVKWELEDLAFRHLQPEDYREISAKLSGRRAARERYIARVVEVLKAELESHALKAEISGRAKHIYSIWRKMQSRNADISQIYDLLAVRILVDTVAECYQALGLLHGRYQVLPQRFKDYISVPKPNGYRSVHTGVIGPLGQRIEIQDERIAELVRAAEHGFDRPVDVEFCWEGRELWLVQCRPITTL